MKLPLNANYFLPKSVKRTTADEVQVDRYDAAHPSGKLPDSGSLGKHLQKVLGSV